MKINTRKRVVIENVLPEINAGRFPIKRAAGENVIVSADIFADGHDVISAVILYKKRDSKSWEESAMKPLGNDRWQGSFIVKDITSYNYTILAWVDRFKSWQSDLRKKFGANQDIKTELLAGLRLIEQVWNTANAKAVKVLTEAVNLIKNGQDASKIVSYLLSDEVSLAAWVLPERKETTRYEKELAVTVERKEAVFSAWYEIFPRSSSPVTGRPGTLNDCAALLGEIAEMGFSVIYLPPIYPIGKTNRKGKNNFLQTQENDPGSPWAIGSEAGGHMSIDPSLGTMADFEKFVRIANAEGLEVAMDLAFQCSPDHPYIKQHPGWFKKKPDGTIQYAENPPKKYEDIVAFNFGTNQWEDLWQELKGVVLFWIKKGIKIFRVDNPHTKPFAFWEWLINEIKAEYPETIFLSEAFTRPKVMYELAKIGFSQSYTYFTWRNTKREFMEYLTELTQTDVKEYFRPNFWPNTPDILPGHLQYGGRPAFIARFILASTLSSNYGIFGPAFELCVNGALSGKEEYANSEKYQICWWDRNKEGNLKDIISLVNKIRKDNSCLQETNNLKFYDIDNEQLLFFGKATEDLSNIILVAVNMDPFHIQSGWARLPLAELGIDSTKPYLVHDLISNDKYIWQGERNYIELNLFMMPAHILRVHRAMRRESDFDYYH